MHEANTPYVVLIAHTDDRLSVASAHEHGGNHHLTAFDQVLIAARRRTQKDGGRSDPAAVLCCSAEAQVAGAVRNSARIGGETRTWPGIDRMRIADGMAVEEHVVFDSAVLQPGG